MSQNLESSTMLQQILNSPDRYGRGMANRVLNLMSEILNRRYPRVEDITESKLLEWKMWPSFLGMIGKYITSLVMQPNPLHKAFIGCKHQSNNSSQLYCILTVIGVNYSQFDFMM